MSQGQGSTYSSVVDPLHTSTSVDTCSSTLQLDPAYTKSYQCDQAVYIVPLNSRERIGDLNQYLVKPSMDISH